MSDETTPETLLVRRCEFVNCCGGVNGCNGIYCHESRWERMTPDEYREHYQKEPPDHPSSEAARQRGAGEPTKQPDSGRPA